MKTHQCIRSLCLLLAVILTACSNPPDNTPEVAIPTGTMPAPLLEPTATLEPVNAFQHQQAEISCPLALPGGAVEGENISCYTITMPEQHAQPGSKPITLTVAVVKSLQQPPLPDPLFMLAGGPGSSALQTFIPVLFSPAVTGDGATYRSHRDVIIVEQRGTLYATPYLYCDEVTAMNQDFMGKDYDKDERREILGKNLQDCYTRLQAQGINLSAYNSVENAADVAAVASVLGYESINLYGGSYGTILAQHLMRDYPQLIRSVILDSIAPLRHNPNLLHKADSMDRSLRLLFQQCAEDPACDGAYPDLESRYFEIVAELNQEPVTVEITDPYTQKVYPLLLNGDKLIEITRNYLYLTPLLPSLPGILAHISDGKYEELVVLQSALTFNQDLADGMYKSVVCSELVDFTVEDLSESAELYPDVVRVMHNMLEEIWVDTCEIWKVEPLQAEVKSSVASDIPVLLLSGEFDPTTPPSLASIAAEKMNHAYSITYPAIAHGVLATSDCATAIMLKFYDNPSLHPDAQCIMNLSGLEFKGPGDDDEKVSLVPVNIEAKGIGSIAPENWTEIQPGLFVRGSSALDQTLLIFDVVPDQEPDVFGPGLLNFLNIEAFPGESTMTLESNGITWSLYRIESAVNGADISSAVALGKDSHNAYVVILLTNPEESDGLYEAVFQPAVQAVEPLN